MNRFTQIVYSFLAADADRAAGLAAIALAAATFEDAVKDVRAFWLDNDPDLDAETCAAQIARCVMADGVEWDKIVAMLRPDDKDTYHAITATTHFVTYLAPDLMAALVSMPGSDVDNTEIDPEQVEIEATADSFVHVLEDTVYADLKAAALAWTGSARAFAEANLRNRDYLAASESAGAEMMDFHLWVKALALAIRILNDNNPKVQDG